MSVGGAHPIKGAAEIRLLEPDRVSTRVGITAGLMPYLFSLVPQSIKLPSFSENIFY
jgi:hypothetical protein